MTRQFFGSRPLAHVVITATTVLLLFGCGASNSDHDHNPGNDTNQNNNDTVVLTSCTEMTSLFGVEATALDGPEDCKQWLDKVRGRVGNNVAGSFVVWSRRTESGVGLMVAAIHTLGQGWFGADNTEVPRQMREVEQEWGGIMRLNLPPADGTLSMDTISPMFELFNASIPAEQNANKFQDILPRHDFFVGLIDKQRFTISSGASPMAGPLEVGLLPLYDPQEHTLNDPTVADAEEEELVMMMGYPQQGEFRELGAASVGRVLSDAEAEQALEALKAAGDDEGAIAYDPEAEFVIEGTAVAGMSGGGVFNTDGELIGVLVRASHAEIGTYYTRAVRMSFIQAQFQEAFDELDDAMQGKVVPFMELP